MKNLIIIGAGGHAAEIVDYIEYINFNSMNPKYTIVGLLDNTESYYNHYGFNYKFLGNTDTHLIDKEIYYVIGIGNVSVRKKVIDEYVSKGAKFKSIIHPTALISKTATIGEGSLISHNVSIGPKANIGKFCVINSRSTIGHDSEFGENNFLSPQVVIGGFSKIGNSNLFGTNSSVIPDTKIGDNNKIMAGMTVVNKVKDNEVVFYRFKEKLIVRNNNQNNSI